MGRCLTLGSFGALAENGKLPLVGLKGEVQWLDKLHLNDRFGPYKILKSISYLISAHKSAETLGCT